MNSLCRTIVCIAMLALPLSVSLAGPGNGPLDNPPPTAALNGYGKFQLKPLTIAAPYAGKASNEKAAAKIREHITAQLEPIVAAWTTAGTASGKTGTLVIEPVIEQIKFVGGAARFWVGAMAGSSYVILKLKLSDQETGAVIADPEFYQRAAAMSGAWTIGGQDNDMLQRIVTITTAYLNGNYESAVGGPTGRDKK